MTIKDINAVNFAAGRLVDSENSDIQSMMNLLYMEGNKSSMEEILPIRDKELKIISDINELPSGVLKNKNWTYFQTSGGYIIGTNSASTDVRIYKEDGTEMSIIAGDPHVSENGSRNKDGAVTWNFHYGDNSYFNLDDGTQILFNSVKNWRYDEYGQPIYHNRGLIIKDGNKKASFGLSLDDETMMKTEVVDFDGSKNFEDLGVEGSGIFAWSEKANEGRGGWTVAQKDLLFYDVAYESWVDYRTKDSGFDGQIAEERGNQVDYLSKLSMELIKESSNSSNLDTLKNFVRILEFGTAEDLKEFYSLNYRSLEKGIKELKATNNEDINELLTLMMNEIGTHLSTNDSGRASLTQKEKNANISSLNLIGTRLSKLGEDIRIPGQGEGSGDQKVPKGLEGFMHYITEGDAENAIKFYQSNYRSIEKDANKAENATLSEQIKLISDLVIDLNSKIESDPENETKYLQQIKNLELTISRLEKLLA